MIKLPDGSEIHPRLRRAGLREATRGEFQAFLREVAEWFVESCHRIYAFGFIPAPLPPPPAPLLLYKAHWSPTTRHKARGRRAIY